MFTDCIQTVCPKTIETLKMIEMIERIKSKNRRENGILNIYVSLSLLSDNP